MRFISFSLFHFLSPSLASSSERIVFERLSNKSHTFCPLTRSVTASRKCPKTIRYLSLLTRWFKHTHWQTTWPLTLSSHLVNNHSMIITHRWFAITPFCFSFISLQLAGSLLLENKKEAEREWGVHSLHNTDYNQDRHPHWKWKVSLGRMLMGDSLPNHPHHRARANQRSKRGRKKTQKGHHLMIEGCIKRGSGRILEELRKRLWE